MVIRDIAVLGAGAVGLSTAINLQVSEDGGDQ